MNLKKTMTRFPKKEEKHASEMRDTEEIGEETSLNEVVNNDVNKTENRERTARSRPNKAEEAKACLTQAQTETKQQAPQQRSARSARNRAKIELRRSRSTWAIGSLSGEKARDCKTASERG